MKHFMLPRSTILRDNQHYEATTITPSSSPTPKHPSSAKSKKPKRSSSTKENADPNSMSPAPSSCYKSPLPPRPPPSNSLKRKLSLESAAAAAALDSGTRAVSGGGSGSGYSDSGVRVIVRMRPPNKNEEEGDVIVQKISNDTLTIGGHSFTFDSIADNEATQVDVFQLVGQPLVENCLAGFNSSVFAYGQTGSGKTYTIWGPANAILGENLLNDQQGLTPRVFQRLFARIDEEQTKHADKQLVYQCRCSFLEIYNEQITDLLDPTQKNLQIREDVKTGVYVENLTEEYVSTMKDVTHLLLRGLSNRRTGATSINAESSRSHSVFTCVVESRCKSAEGGLCCLKKSRINLVDLAGSERQKLTGAAGERLKEAGNINRSLSQLGNLINILAEVSQTGKQRHIPYRDSKLTFLLQESLGGNAKLAMICAISPAQSCKSETFSTLRFAQRAKVIKNKAVVNEEMQDDVNVLRQVIRQLKEELLRMKANGSQTDANANFSSRWSARRSLNLLKFSLNRPLTLPHVDDDSDEEMEIVEEPEENIQQGLEFGSSSEGITQPMICGSAHTEQQVSEEIDVNMDEDCEQADKNETEVPKSVAPNQHSCTEDNAVSDLTSSSLKTNCNDSFVLRTEEPLPSSLSASENVKLPKLDVEHPSKQISANITMEDTPERSPECLENGRTPTNISIVPSDISPVLKSPTPSVSPRVSNSSSKSFRISSSSTVNTKSELEGACLSFAKPSNSICLNSSTQRKPTEYLVASLHRGLEIIDSHRKSTALRKSSFRFSCKPPDIKTIIPVSKVDVGVQTLLQDCHDLQDDSSTSLCSKCTTKNYQEELKEANENANMQLAPIDGPESCDKYKNHVPKAVEKVLAGAIRREMALEEICAQQNNEIMQLNRLIQQYKHERECNAIISQTREDKIVRLESLMDGILTPEEFMDDEMLSLVHEHKILKERYKNHPEVSRVQIELKRVEDELERYRNFFDMGERDVLLEEIQDLRSQLQSYIDSSVKSSKKQNAPILQLTNTSEPGVAPPLPMVPESMDEIVEQRLEQERIKWTEAESKWISLVEELRLELDASRILAQKQKQELDMEKNCSEEQKEAMHLAMQCHARLLEQYAELEEKHMQLLLRNRKMQDGIGDVKKAAAKAGVRGAESKFINALAAEISLLKVEREKERHYFRDEIKGLQAQLRDTAEAVQAAGELLVRLKEAEEAVAAAENRATEAEKDAIKAYKQIEKLKKKYEKEIIALNRSLANSHPPKEAPNPVYDDDCKMPSIDADKTTESAGDHQWKDDFEPFYNAEEEELSKLGEPNPVYDDDCIMQSIDADKTTESTGDHQWKDDIEPFYNAEEEELSKLGEPPSSWFSGYDRCNI